MWTPGAPYLSLYGSHWGSQVLYIFTMSCIELVGSYRVEIPIIGETLISSEWCQTWTMTWLQERKEVALSDILYDICTMPASLYVLTKLAPLEHTPLVE